MKKYALIFAIAYLLNTVIIAGISHALDAGGGAGLNIVATIAASFIAAWRFAKEHERIPTDAEKKSYAWAALAAVWVVSLILVAGVLGLMLSAVETQVLLNFASSGMFPVVAIVGAIVLSIVYYVVIRWAFSWYVKQTCDF